MACNSRWSVWLPGTIEAITVSRISSLHRANPVTRCRQQPAVFHVKLPQRPNVLELKPSTVAGERVRTLVRADFPRHPSTKLSTAISTTCTLEPRGRHAVEAKALCTALELIDLPGSLLGRNHYLCPRNACDGLFLQQPAPRLSPTRDTGPRSVPPRVASRPPTDYIGEAASLTPRTNTVTSEAAALFS